MKSMIKRAGALLLVGAVFAACSESSIDSPVAPQFGQASIDGPDVVTIAVCKVWVHADAQGDYTFAFSGAQADDGEVVLTAGNGTGVPILGGCDDPGASTTFQVDRGSTFSVTELAVGEGLATLSSVSLLPYEGEPGDNPEACTLNEAQETILATGTASVTIDDNTCGAGFYQIGFKNSELEEEEEEEAEGRMTGGGVKAFGFDEVAEEDVRVTLGLTLHCDNDLSNNLQVNWAGGNQWHIKKESLASVVCTKPDDPTPPVAPISRFEATSPGRLNGQDGSWVEFVFEDKGEPGRDDTIEMVIWPGEIGVGTPVLTVPFQTLAVGNFQMHYDQPHGQKPDKN